MSSGAVGLTVGVLGRRDGLGSTVAKVCLQLGERLCMENWRRPLEELPGAPAPRAIGAQKGARELETRVGRDAVRELRRRVFLRATRGDESGTLPELLCLG